MFKGVKYSFIGVSLNENHGLLLNCDPDEYRGVCNIIPYETPPYTGYKIDEYYGYDKYTVQGCFIALLIYILGCRLISYVALRMQ